MELFKRFWVLLFLFFVLIGCRSAGDDGTPTPFTAAQPTTPLQVQNEVIRVNMGDLAANPAFFENSHIQITGQYTSFPKLICGRVGYPSPATWGLIEGGLLANAGGFDGQLRSLLPEESTITVEGHWLRWRGAVGCGKQAPVQDIWYLSTSRIISPSPLVGVTQTPVSIAAAETAVPNSTPNSTPTEIPALLPTPAAGGTDAPTPTSGKEEPQETAVPQGTVVKETAAPSSPTPTPIHLVTSTSLSQTATSNPTASPTGTVQAEATVDGTPTGTPAGTIPTATTGPAVTTIDQGEIGEQDLQIKRIEPHTVHVWTVEISGTNALTLTLAMPGGVPLSLEVLDAGETAVGTLSVPSTQQIALLQDIPIISADAHTIRVRNDSNTPTDYAIMPLFEESFHFSFHGFLSPSSSQNGTLGIENDQFWFFMGVEDSIITLTIQPANSTDDVYVDMYNPNADQIVIINESGAGEPETLPDFSLPQTGLYAVRIAEYGYLPMAYQVTLTEE